MMKCIFDNDVVISAAESLRDQIQWVINIRIVCFNRGSPVEQTHPVCRVIQVAAVLFLLHFDTG